MWWRQRLWCKHVRTMISSLVWEEDTGGARKRAHFLQHFCSLWTCFSIRPPITYTLEENPSQYSSSQRRVKNQLHQLYEELINCIQDVEGMSWSITLVASPIPPEVSSSIKKKFCSISWIIDSFFVPFAAEAAGEDWRYNVNPTL